jgi:DNA-binding transcriptional LysR family regulator
LHHGAAENSLFLTFCEERNFTRAAKRCGVSQPSLTMVIKKLEAKFDGPLFMRDGRTSRLSGLGMIVRPYLGAIDRAAADAKREAAAFLAAPLSVPKSHWTLMRGAADGKA